MKYCIGCIHMFYRPADPGRMGSDETGRWGESDASLLCRREHWQQDLGGGSDIPVSVIAANMAKANSCPDYEERET
jgi:hypothetical protein